MGSATAGTQASNGLARWQTPLLVIAACALIAVIGFGTRSVFGLFLPPMTEARGWSREAFSVAMATQQLTFGVVLPLAAASSDRFGPVRVMVAGAVAYALGLWLMTLVESALVFLLVAGLLVGGTNAFTSFSLVIATMARMVEPKRRPLVMGLGMAAGSLGQVIFSPITQGFISAFGWSDALLILAVGFLAIVPLAFLLPGNPEVAAEQSAKESVGAAIREAVGHRGYLLLTMGFFVCGFHVAFITVHLPAYMLDLGFEPRVGAIALSLIGFFNIVGSFLSGMAGTHLSRRLSLSFIYASRAVVIAAFLLLPKTEPVAYMFASLMGLLWLATVPLTNAIVARVFGVRYLATLFSFVFLSHQLGSFSGIWLAGGIYEATGSYDGMWVAGIILGIAAALIHLPINERPIARLAEAQG
jgi:MFS family permease